MSSLGFFDCVIVIGRSARADRWAETVRQFCGLRWPFRTPLRMQASEITDGPPPVWWLGTSESWAQFDSHRRALALASKRGARSVLVLEDDVAVRPELGSGMNVIQSTLRRDSQFLTFGGNVYRYDKHPCYTRGSEVHGITFVDRTHAYALANGGIEIISAKLGRSAPSTERGISSWAEWLSHLVRSGALKGYGVWPPLIGQRQGYSDVAKRVLSERFWNEVPQGGNRYPFVPVIGVHRSGTSCVAAILHKLGIFMGVGVSSAIPGQAFECRVISEICEHAYPFPSMRRAVARETSLEGIRSYCAYAASVSAPHNRHAGFKYPTLSALGPELREATNGHIRAIHIDRPLGESIESLVSRSSASTGWLRAIRQDVEQLQRWLWERKCVFLESVPHLTIDFHRLVSDPYREIARVIEFLGIDPGKDRIRNAIATVRRDLPRHSLLPSRGPANRQCRSENQKSYELS
jgi:hypothetical protein